MRKCWIPAVIFLICAFIITGCGNASPTPVIPAGTTAPAVTTPTTAAPAVTTSAAAKPAVTTPAATAPPAATPATDKAKYGGILRFVLPSAPGTPIGWMAETAGASVTTMQLVMEYPLQEDLNGDIRPHLATSYEVNSDPQNPSITFTFRKGVKFHDGSDFNAQAVKWNLEQVKSGALNASTTRYWKSFDLLDDYTLRVNLTEWQNRQVRSFGNPSCIITSPTAYEKNGLEWIRWNMVGTGAFKQVEFQKDVALKAVRNDNYWDAGKPYLDGFHLLYVADELTRLALFKSGGADIVDLAGNARVATELKNEGYQILTRPSGTSMLIGDSMNADSPWANQKVRQAAEYAIDKEAIVRTFGYGLQRAAYQLPSPDSKAYIPEIKGHKYDVSKAKQLLTEAGYPNGFKTKIIAQTIDNRDIIVALQSFLGKIGIQADLEFVDSAKYQAYQSGTWNNALLYSNVIHYANYNSVLAQWFGVPASWFKSMQRPEGWETIVTATITSTQPEPALMQKCVQALYDNTTVIPLSYGTALWAITDKVQDSGVGTRGSSTQWNSQNAWLSK